MKKTDWSQQMLISLSNAINVGKIAFAINKTMNIFIFTEKFRGKIWGGLYLKEHQSKTLETTKK